MSREVTIHIYGDTRGSRPLWTLLLQDLPREFGLQRVILSNLINHFAPIGESRETHAFVSVLGSIHIRFPLGSFTQNLPQSWDNEIL